MTDKKPWPRGEQLRVAMVADCPKGRLVRDHYYADGTCKCQDNEGDMATYANFRDLALDDQRAHLKALLQRGGIPEREARNILAVFELKARLDERDAIEDEKTKEGGD